MAYGAIVDGSGAVVNLIVYDGEAPLTPPAGMSMVDVGVTPVAIGWTHGADGFVAPAAPIAPVPAVVVPSSVSKVQAVLALHALPGAEAGKTLLDDVNATVAAAADPRVLLAWDNASTIERNGLFVTQLAAAPTLALTGPQLDELFIAAAQISV